MLLIIGLTLFAAACRKVITISEKLSLQTWKLLSHVQVLLFLACLWGLQQSTPVPPPPVQTQSAAHPSIVLPETNNSTIINFSRHPFSSPRFMFDHLAAIDPPSITSVSPDPVPAANNSQNVSVSGSGFQTGLTVTVLAHEPGHTSFVIRNTGSTAWYATPLHLSSTALSTAPGPFHLHVIFAQNDFPNFRRFVDPPPPVVVVSSNQASSDPGLLYWAQLLGAIILPIGIISTNVLAWVLYNKSRVEAAAAQAKQHAELEKLKLENQKLAFELFQAKQAESQQRIILG